MAVRLEDTRPQEDTEEEVQDHPIKTMLYYMDAHRKDDPTTAIRKALQGKQKSLSQSQQMSLHIMEGDQTNNHFLLSKTETVVGRDKRCDIVLRDPEVSARHCGIVVFESVAVLKDLGSTNGTVLNGYLIKEDLLKDGDKIQVGVTTLQFCIEPK
jgi:pSer/pThr/pTyr-binding forkhead associated (FHA) protein